MTQYNSQPRSSWKTWHKIVIGVIGAFSLLMLIGTARNIIERSTFSAEEKALVQVAQKSGVSLPEGQIVDFGHRTCAVIDDTASPNLGTLIGIALGMQKEEPSLAKGHAVTLVGASVGALCPEYSFLTGEW